MKQQKIEIQGEWKILVKHYDLSNISQDKLDKIKEKWIENKFRLLIYEELTGYTVFLIFSIIISTWLFPSNFLLLIILLVIIIDYLLIDKSTEIGKKEVKIKKRLLPIVFLIGFLSIQISLLMVIILFIFEVLFILQTKKIEEKNNKLLKQLKN